MAWGGTDKAGGKSGGAIDAGRGDEINKRLRARGRLLFECFTSKMSAKETPVSIHCAPIVATLICEARIWVARVVNRSVTPRA